VPWHVEKREDRYCVVKETDGSTEKCHDTREQATRHMAALYAAESENRATSFSTESWDGSAGRWPDAASYCRSSLVDNNPAGAEKTKSECHFPVKAPGSNAYNVNALRAVVGGRGAQAEFPGAEAARATARRLLAQYNSSTENRAERSPIESRAATVGEISFPQRTIEVLAVPYDQEALVEYRGELWLESFERGAFDGIQDRPDQHKVKAYRDHVAGAHMRGTSTSGLVGQVVSFAPDRPDGLLGVTKIAPTPLGDETLTLANMGILGVSVGFGVRGSDQVLNRSQQPPRRRIRRAFVDHLAFPDNGAYEGAQVIDVRRERQEARELPKLETPRLDEIVAWMESRR
jgi:phage head maturation protease